MNIKIAAICNSDLSGKLLKEAGSKLGIIVNYEIQNEKGIINKLSENIIQNSNIVLFVTEKEVEQIEEIERFIDREYYEVLPQFVIKNPENVISEITLDLN
ncbi:PTS sugar transporter subunit IIBC [Terrisporobacter vanillatitrophus]|uniref:PTS sugar transporter subunit IIBC n=1 Tax=Terrisporobacter vanillatitrophus TaxID=3058402 RepID=UPI003368BF38